MGWTRSAILSIVREYLAGHFPTARFAEHPDQPTGSIVLHDPNSGICLVLTADYLDGEDGVSAAVQMIWVWDLASMLRLADGRPVSVTAQGLQIVVNDPKLLGTVALPCAREQNARSHE